MASAPRRPGAPPLPSSTLAIGQALAGSEPLALLARRMRESQDRLAAITPLLPPAMRSSVRAGPIDDTGWSLLASSNAVAAKLRQMLPALEAHLRTRGWDGPPLRVKLLGPG
ncbi:hypothetical protein [Pseudaquabacterium pictum]|uniref:DUF721 domain-containing protein n=1 Tax=Pseudaquabacterium pictum TaxID=2315236 RepID=A0A480ALT1_9BURK|nr:hypothetical protein [Rubrivivax pictus]GCL62353.1 hypothetical protein AQPW35_14340 [Rubrivivax pictus]